MKVYKVWVDENKESAPFHAQNIRDIGIDCMEEVGETMIVELVEMPAAEFEALPEWMGP
jgi:hypothetical protein